MLSETFKSVSHALPYIEQGLGLYMFLLGLFCVAMTPIVQRNPNAQLSNNALAWVFGSQAAALMAVTLNVCGFKGFLVLGFVVLTVVANLKIFTSGYARVKWLKLYVSFQVIPWDEALDSDPSDPPEDKLPDNVVQLYPNGTQDYDQGA